MCGRFSFFDFLGFQMRFSLQIPALIQPRYNIAPSQEILAIVNPNLEGYQTAFFKWGLIPYWSKDGSSARKMINARAETVDQKPSFKQSFQKRRCLIPADGFFEWEKQEIGKKPYRIVLKNREVFAFAGLWDAWTDPSGQTVHSCTIITTSANSLLAAIHLRMPVILAKEAEEAWLHPETDQLTLKNLLLPYPAALMESYEVSVRVNSPRNDDPSIIEPLRTP